MAREIRYRDGRLDIIPMPLETSKLTKIVNRYRGKPYRIFVDESMRSFFGFKQPNGYLCYAAVGIPEEEHVYVQRAMALIHRDYEFYVTGDTEMHLTEFKFDRFRSLPEDQRRSLAQRIEKVFKVYGIFVTAFFIHTKGAVMEQVRSGLVGTADIVPKDSQALYDEAAETLRKSEADGVAQAETIYSILRIPLSGLANFLGYFQCPFKIYCDPREAKEDRAVLAAIDDFFKGPMAAISPGEAVLYGGMNNLTSSEDEIGLQLADILTGEVRTFFEENPGFLTAGASPELITGVSVEEVMMYSVIMNIKHKSGALVDMPEDLQEKLNVPSGVSSLPLYKPSFAAGLLSCYNDSGQPQHIELYGQRFFHQLD